MSFVKTVPAAIAAAATQLEGIGNSFAAESSAAAGSTTAIAPAAADEVSILQAACSLPMGSSTKRSAPKPRPFTSSS